MYKNVKYTFKVHIYLRLKFVNICRNRQLTQNCVSVGAELQCYQSQSALS